MSTAFGLAVRSAGLALPGLGGDAPGDGGAPVVEVILASADAVAGAFSGSRDDPERARADLDGEAWTVERGRDGDLLMAYGSRGAFHLDATAERLRCGAPDPRAPAFQRVLLDSALTTASLARGFDALHAGAVAVGGGAVAILGPPGAGKTTLVAELLRRGHPLVADDVLVLTAAGGSVLAHPAPPVMNVPHAGPAVAGTVLHRFAREDWVLADDRVRAPVPLRAVLLLDRGAGAPARLEALAAPAPVLLAHALDSGRDPARRGRRFALLGDVAEAVTVARLAADGATAPSDLADLIESGI